MFVYYVLVFFIVLLVWAAYELSTRKPSDPDPPKEEENENDPPKTKLANKPNPMEKSEHSIPKSKPKPVEKSEPSTSKAN